MSALAEIPARLSGDMRAGSLRREDLEAFEGLLSQHGRGALLVTGAGDGRIIIGTGSDTNFASTGVPFMPNETYFLAAYFGYEEGNNYAMLMQHYKDFQTRFQSALPR